MGAAHFRALLYVFVFAIIGTGFCLKSGPEFAPVYFTLNSLYREQVHSKTLKDREIQVHWANGTADKILIYNQEPNESVEPIFQVITSEHPECFVETNYSFGNPEFPGGWDWTEREQPTSPPLPGDHCLPAWLVAYIGGERVFSDCLKIRPTWMQDNRLFLEKLKVNAALLPGTHNSGSYKRGETLSYRDTSGRYIITQDQSVWSQLVYGSRYIDLRVAYYPSARNNSEGSEFSFWINHDLIKVRPLNPLIQDIKNFLRKTKEEILIVDLHRFPAGFNGRQSRHSQLIGYLERELREYAMPFRRGDGVPTFGDIWDQGKRIILSYGDFNIAKEHEWLWPPIRQVWGNKQSVESLFTFLDSCMHNDSLRGGSGPWAAMAELTPTPMDFFLQPKGSLREMAHRVNRHLTVWCRELWWDTANIIAPDFFLGTDLINTAVSANIFKGSPPKQYSID